MPEFPQNTSTCASFFAVKDLKYTTAMKKTTPLHFALFVTVLALYSFAYTAEVEAHESVKIGKQIWMTKNLNVSTFRNGDPIFHAATAEAWKEAAQNEKPAWCYISHDKDTGESHGKLYNHFAVKDPRGLAPEGWHVPSDEEWTELTDYLGKNAGHKMKAGKDYIKDGAGNNKSGFSGLLSGHCFFNGMFTNYRVSATWHSTTPTDEPGRFYTRQITAMSKEVSKGIAYEVFGLSVRCVKD